MGISHRRRRGALAASVAVASIVGGVVAPAPAGAEDVVVEGPPPPELVAHFADICPRPERFTAQPLYCLTVRAYDGEIKLGDTVAAVPGPIEITVGIAAAADAEGNIVAEIVTGGPGSGDRSGTGGGGGGGGFAPVEIAGGVLGMPELDPVIELVPQLLGVSASPRIGSPAPAPAPGTNPLGAALAFITWVGSNDPGHVALNLPLSIEVNNLLLGSQCSIPEFAINLTTATTAPPAGVEPMVGSVGEHARTSYVVGVASDDVHRRTGARLVDNTFAVPGASKCDLLVGDLLDQPTGLFDPLLNAQTGLPSPAGRNHAAFSVDTELVGYPMLLPRLTGTGGASFGNVPPGSVSQPLTATFTHTGLSSAYDITLGPATLGGLHPASFEITEDLCNGAVLAQGDQCTVSLRFKPTSATPLIQRTILSVGGTNLSFTGLARA